MSNTILEPFSALKDLIECFAFVEARYVVGGSVASSVMGEFRTTHDIDVLCELPGSRLSAFCSEAARYFSVDSEAVQSHLEIGRSYNILHEETCIKIDLFPAVSGFHQKELERALCISPSGSPCSFRIATAEDIVLAKLDWYHRGGRTSQRQINDVRSVLLFNQSTLDETYLKEWADQLKVLDLLTELLAT